MGQLWTHTKDHRAVLNATGGHGVVTPVSITTKQSYDHSKGSTTRVCNNYTIL